MAGGQTKVWMARRHHTPEEIVARLRQSEQGNMAWQRTGGYGRCRLVETAISRDKHPIGPKLCAGTLLGQRREATPAAAALTRVIRTAKPVSVRRT